MLLGSGYAFIGVALYGVLISLRTYLEDRTLMEELLGYPEYAEKVRYRLIPFVW